MLAQTKEITNPTKSHNWMMRKKFSAIRLLEQFDHLNVAKKEEKYTQSNFRKNFEIFISLLSHISFLSVFILTALIGLCFSSINWIFFKLKTQQHVIFKHSLLHNLHIAAKIILISWGENNYCQKRINKETQILWKCWFCTNHRLGWSSLYAEA